MDNDLPGYRFMPRDEELIEYYLRPKVFNPQALHRRTNEVIHTTPVYQKSPQELSNLYPPINDLTNDVWYFFTPRDRKYPNGSRPNRAAGNGYWKATGADKTIFNKEGIPFGLRKALVFYVGKPPKGVKTEWVMHEWRVTDAEKIKPDSPEDMRLDNFVLCRIHGKPNNNPSLPQQEEDDAGVEIRGDTQQEEDDEHNIDNAPQDEILQAIDNNQDQLVEIDDIDPYNHYDGYFNDKPPFGLGDIYSQNSLHDMFINQYAFGGNLEYDHSQQQTPQFSQGPALTDHKPVYNVPLEGGLYSYLPPIPNPQFLAPLESEPNLKPPAGYDGTYHDYPAPNPINQYPAPSKQNGFESNQFLEKGNSSTQFDPYLNSTKNIGHSFHIVDDMKKMNMHHNDQLTQTQPGAHELESYGDSMKSTDQLKQSQPVDQKKRKVGPYDHVMLG